MIDYGIENIEREIKNKLIDELMRTGILFRLFSRIKNHTSIEEKLFRKSYSKEHKLMQDLIGFRITTYFNDDLKIVIELCEKIFDKVELVYDEPDTEVFKPLRKNMICKFNENQTKTFIESAKNNENFELIDNTFEIQFRTTLSEGWHEVDHLMRYKCQTEWVGLTYESRMLNGIYATLETNDQALKALFEEISYHHYKSKKWEAMLRNKLRLRFSLQKLDEDISTYLDENNDIGKAFYKLNRNIILNTYITSTLSLPITFNHWVYFINHCFIKDQFITSKTPTVLVDEFHISLNCDFIKK